MRRITLTSLALALGVVLALASLTLAQQAPPTWKQGQPRELADSPLAPIAQPPAPRAPGEIPIEKIKVPPGFKVSLWAHGINNAPGHGPGVVDPVRPEGDLEPGWDLDLLDRNLAGRLGRRWLGDGRKRRVCQLTRLALLPGGRGLLGEGQRSKREHDAERQCKRCQGDAPHGEPPLEDRADPLRGPDDTSRAPGLSSRRS